MIFKVFTPVAQLFTLNFLNTKSTCITDLFHLPFLS